MFQKSLQDPDLLELDQEALFMFNSYIVASDDDPNRKAFILNALLSAAVFDPDLAQMVTLAVASAVTQGVEKTIKDIQDNIDLSYGADEVEKALAEGVL